MSSAIKKICVIGCGPAGAVVAAMLKRIGYDVLVVAKARRLPLWEGMSTRAADGLISAGFHRFLDATSKRARRFSAWHGHVELANGEYLIEKQSLERALQNDLSKLGIVLIQAVAHHYKRHEIGWDIAVSEEDGTEKIIHADFFVAACGRTGGENLAGLSGPVSVMLSQLFSVRLGSEPFTFIEPFEDGWAWATWNGIDHASIHVTVAGALIAANGCNQIFTASCRKLDEIQKMIDNRSLAISPVSARGSRPFLKRTIADVWHLSVGDAAYTVDPLSGHGMYEAIAGAYAAVPAIHTILERPEGSKLALQFYQDRARSLFSQRMKNGIELYKGERRWADKPFWVERSQNMSATLDVQPVFPDKSYFVKRPVIENGWIVEREVLLSQGHPQGIRFIDGVDLAKLYRLMNMTQVFDPNQLSQILVAPSKDIASAMQSLVQEGMVTQFGSRF